MREDGFNDEVGHCHLVTFVTKKGGVVFCTLKCNFVAAFCQLALVTIVMARIRVLIVDNHEEVRRALAVRLRSSAAVEIVGVLGTHHWPESQEVAVKPDVVILGLAAGHETHADCLQLVTRLTEQGTAVLALASYIDDRVREKILKAGARRCLLKNINTPQLISEIQQAASDWDSLPSRQNPAGWSLNPS